MGTLPSFKSHTKCSFLNGSFLLKENMQKNSKMCFLKKLDVFEFCLSMHYASIFNFATVVYFVDQSRKRREEFKKPKKIQWPLLCFFCLGFLIWFGIPLVKHSLHIMIRDVFKILSEIYNKTC